MTQLDLRRWLAFVLFAALMQGCAGFKPSNEPGRIAWAQERLDTSLTAIERSYDSNLIDKPLKDRILDDYWQPAKDLEAEVTADFVENGASDTNKTDTLSRKIRVMVAFLVAKGVMQQ